MLDLHQLQQLAEGFSLLGATQGAQGIQGSGLDPGIGEHRSLKSRQDQGDKSTQVPELTEGWP